MPVSERQVCQRNIHITICSSNTVVLWQFCYLKDLFFNCSQSILRYSLNVNFFGGGMGRETFFFPSSHSPRSSLCPDGIEDQWAGTAGRPAGVGAAGSSQGPGPCGAVLRLWLGCRMWDEDSASRASSSSPFLDFQVIQKPAMRSQVTKSS